MWLGINMRDYEKEYREKRYKEELEYHMKWESVDSLGGGSQYERLTRFKVPNGWLYKLEKRVEINPKQGYQIIVSTSFVPESVPSE